MLDEIHTYSHPDVTPAQVLSSRDVTPAQVLLKRHNSLTSPLDRLSNGQLLSTSSTNTNIIDAKDPRIMPPPSKAVIRRNILMGRPSAINAATSAVRSRSLWNRTTKATTQGPIPCPPTPPDSLASSSESDTTGTRELSPREQKQHKHKQQQERTLARHSLPTLIGIKQHATNQNKANIITTTTVPPLKGKTQFSSSIPPPPLQTHFMLPRSSSETIDLAKKIIDWQSSFHSFGSMILCLTILSTFDQVENNNNSLSYFIIMNGFKMIGLSLFIIFLCEYLIKSKIFTTELIQWPMFQYWVNNKLYPFLVTHDPYFCLTCVAVIEMMTTSQLICLIIYLGPKLFMELSTYKKKLR